MRDPNETTAVDGLRLQEQLSGLGGGKQQVESGSDHTSAAPKQPENQRYTYDGRYGRKSAGDPRDQINRQQVVSIDTFEEQMQIRDMPDTTEQ
jgi:hypothetical protein